MTDGSRLHLMPRPSLSFVAVSRKLDIPQLIQSLEMLLRRNHLHETDALDGLEEPIPWNPPGVRRPSSAPKKHEDTYQETQAHRYTRALHLVHLHSLEDEILGRKAPVFGLPGDRRPGLSINEPKPIRQAGANQLNSRSAIAIEASK